jgi:FkbM family methyltransferase
MSSPSFVSYAQNLEDIVLWRGLRHITRGCYIDVGACDPLSESVSRGFYEQGWRGVHFEPNPVFAERLRQDRPDETVHEVAVSDAEGTLRFAMMHDVGLSTGASEYLDEYRTAGRVAEERDVPMTTLAKACAGLAGRDVHWMKIDVEGMEERVLRGWDARTLRPWVVLVEATRPASTEPAHHAWDGLLVDAGYRFVLFDGLNRFYVADEHPELMGPLSVSANIHDIYAGCGIDRSSPFASRAAAQVSAFYESSRTWQLTRPLRRLVSVLSRSGSGHR